MLPKALADAETIMNLGNVMLVVGLAITGGAILWAVVSKLMKKK